MPLDEAFPNFARLQDFFGEFYTNYSAISPAAYKLARRNRETVRGWRIRNHMGVKFATRTPCLGTISATLENSLSLPYFILFGTTFLYISDRTIRKKVHDAISNFGAGKELSEVSGEPKNVEKPQKIANNYRSTVDSGHSLDVQEKNRL